MAFYRDRLQVAGVLLMAGVGATNGAGRLWAGEYTLAAYWGAVAGLLLWIGYRYWRLPYLVVGEFGLAARAHLLREPSLFAWEEITVADDEGLVVVRQGEQRRVPLTCLRRHDREAVVALVTANLNQLGRQQEVLFR
ncbi:MAG TPA: hypothetical protein VD902_18290 [Symbiobacteriaceae bacterium]|nr:hypothetical protein [Symbiobacteriaceae bacterium]